MYSGRTRRQPEHVIVVEACADSFWRAAFVLLLLQPFVQSTPFAIVADAIYLEIASARSNIHVSPHLRQCCNSAYARCSAKLSGKGGGKDEEWQVVGVT